MPTDLRIIECGARDVNGSRRVLARCLLLAAVVGLALLGAGCTRESRAQDLHERAQDHVERAEFVEAVALLDEILERYPDTDVARKARAELSLYRGLSNAVETYAARRVYDQMILTARAIYRFEADRGAWPRSLSDLAPRYLAEAPIDPWGRPLGYAVKPGRRGYVLGCRGADGADGGAGEARDWFIEDGRFVTRPTSELRWP